MDYRLGLLVASLDSYTGAFHRDSVPYLPLEWAQGGQTYYSVLVQNPNTQEVFELVSKTKPAGVEFQAYDGIRHHFTEGVEVEAGSHATALHVSRTSRDLDTVVSFYKEVFGVDPVSQGTSGGAKFAFFQHSSQATVQIQYWQRDQTGEHTTQWFEEYLEAVNAEYMTSYKSCWPVWGDNHYCLDSQQLDVSKIKEIYDKQGYKYHLFQMSGGMGGNGYFELPGGWQMQIDGYWSSSFPSDAGSFQPDYCGNTCGGGP